MGTPFSPFDSQDLETHFDQVSYYALEDLSDQDMLELVKAADEKGLTSFSVTKPIRVGDTVKQRNVLDLCAAFNYLGTTMFLAQKLAEDTSLSEEERIIMLEDAADLTTDDTVKTALGAVAHDINMGHYARPK